jgi:hypothetical protein
MKYVDWKRQTKRRERARDFLCCWTVVELGIPMKELARKFETCRDEVCSSTARENSQGTRLSIRDVSYLNA